MSDSPLIDTSIVHSGPLSQLIDMGGPVMLVLIALALAGVATFIYLVLCGALYSPKLTGKLKRAIDDWQQSPSENGPAKLEQQATRYTRMNPLHSLIVNTMRARLKQQDPQQVREVIARDAQQALEPFEAPLKIIEVIAALAPLLGLLGTVLGMMEAFSAMAATEGRANASQLSGGIYEALTTTAAGLVVAIPFAALAAWVEFRLRRIHKTINSSLVTILSTPVSEEASASPTATHEAPASQAAPSQSSVREARSADHRARLAHATG